jgi:hypothetical protein
MQSRRRRRKRGQEAEPLPPMATMMVMKKKGSTSVCFLKQKQGWNNELKARILEEEKTFIAT